MGIKDTGEETQPAWPASWFEQGSHAFPSSFLEDLRHTAAPGFFVHSLLHSAESEGMRRWVDEANEKNDLASPLVPNYTQLEIPPIYS